MSEQQSDVEKSLDGIAKYERFVAVLPESLNKHLLTFFAPEIQRDYYVGGFAVLGDRVIVHLKRKVQF